MKSVKEMSLRERFDAKGFAVTKYARAHGLSQPILSEILADRHIINGHNRSRKGVTRRTYAQLKKDGVWIGPLPWEAKDEQ